MDGALHFGNNARSAKTMPAFALLCYSTYYTDELFQDEYMGLLLLVQN